MEEKEMNTRADKKDLILEAAYTLLSKGNYQNMTTSRIAAEAGVAEGTLYRYFSGKRQLLLDLIVYYGNRIMNSLFTDVRPENDLRTNLTHFSAEFKRSLESDGHFYSILYKTFSELDEAETFPVLRNYFIQNMDRIRQVFDWAREGREISLNDRETDLMVQSLWGMADGFIKRIILKIDLPVRESELDFTVNLIGKALLPEDK